MLKIVCFWLWDCIHNPCCIGCYERKYSNCWLALVLYVCCIVSQIWTKIALHILVSGQKFGHQVWFPSRETFESKLVLHVQNDHASFVLPSQRAIVNLTVPKRNHANIFTYVELDYDVDEVNVYFVIGVTVASTVVIALMLSHWCYCCVLQWRVVDGSTYYAK